MSDKVTDPVVDPVVEPVVEPEKDLASELEKWKAMSRKNEARAKDNEAAAKRLAEIEEANKTELEKAQARAEAAEKALAERDAAAERDALAREVAASKGLADPSVLVGGSREELEAFADKILALIPPSAPVGVGAAGNRGENIGSLESDLEGQIVAAEKARNFPLAITLKSQLAAQKSKE